MKACGHRRKSFYVAKSILKNPTIPLPDGKIIGAQVLIDYPTFGPGNRIVTLRDIQELRGNIINGQGANAIWRFFAAPIGRAFSFADST